MLAIATVLLPTFSKSPALFIECSQSFHQEISVRTVIVTACCRRSDRMLIERARVDLILRVSVNV